MNQEKFEKTSKKVVMVLLGLMFLGATYYAFRTIGSPIFGKKPIDEQVIHMLFMVFVLVAPLGLLHVIQKKWHKVGK